MKDSYKTQHKYRTFINNMSVSPEVNKRLKYKLFNEIDSFISKAHIQDYSEHQVGADSVNKNKALDSYSIPGLREDTVSRNRKLKHYVKTPPPMRGHNLKHMPLLKSKLSSTTNQLTQR